MYLEIFGIQSNPILSEEPETQTRKNNYNSDNESFTKSTSKMEKNKNKPDNHNFENLENSQKIKENISLSLQADKRNIRDDDEIE